MQAADFLFFSSGFAYFLFNALIEIPRGHKRRRCSCKEDMQLTTTCQQEFFLKQYATSERLVSESTNRQYLFVVMCACVCNQCNYLLRCLTQNRSGCNGRTAHYQLLQCTTGSSQTEKKIFIKKATSRFVWSHHTKWFVRQLHFFFYPSRHCSDCFRLRMTNCKEQRQCSGGQ